VLAGGGQIFDDLLIGSKTGRALGWKNVAGRFSGTVFNRCQFRSGGPQTTQFGGDGSSVTKSDVKVDGLRFNYCWWEASYATSGDARTFGAYVDRAMGQLFRDVTFSHCWFDKPNEQGNYSSWGGIEIWSSWDDIGPYPSDPTNRGYDDITFDSCVFEQTYGWNLDFSGYQYVTEPDFGEGTVTVRNCVFKGCGHIDGEDPSGTGFHVALQIEPGHDCVIENNQFGRSEHNGWKLIKNSNHNVIRNNVFDYVDNRYGITPYSYTVIARLQNDATNMGDNHFTDNVLRLPVGEQQSMTSQGWITYDSSTATVSNNTVVHSDTPVIDYSDIPPLVLP
jgi:hypothetical protein